MELGKGAGVIMHVQQLREYSIWSSSRCPPKIDERGNLFVESQPEPLDTMGRMILKQISKNWVGGGWTLDTLTRFRSAADEIKVGFFSICISWCVRCGCFSRTKRRDDDFGTLKGEKEFYFRVRRREREKREKRSVSGGHCHVIARESPHTHTTGGATSSSRLPTVLRGPSCERRTKLFALTASPAAKECSLSLVPLENKQTQQE